MKKLVTSLMLAGVLSVPAIASADNIGGILVPAGAYFEAGQLYENVVTGVGQTVSGYGSINSISGSTNFCAGGLGTCELTFQFGGFLVTSITPTSIVTSGGWVNFYVGTGSTLNFNPLTSGSSAADIAAATDGSLWLNLLGHTNLVGGFLGTLFGTGTSFGTGSDAGFGSGLLDVDLTGAGYANARFDTNTLADNIGGKADALFTSDFSPTAVPHPSECTGTPPTGASCLAGAASMRGVVLPEPGSLALTGLGLLGLGLGAVARKRKSV